MIKCRTRGAIIVASMLLADDTLVSQVFRSETDAVLVDVLVTDKGRPVSGLSANDFELKDNGVVQKIEISEYQDLPLTILLVLDVSQSVQGAKLEDLKAAVGAVSTATRARDHVALITVSHNIRVRVAPTEEGEALSQHLEPLLGEGGTALYDGVFSALGLAVGQPGRTVLIVFSDGEDTSSWLDPRRVVQAFERSDLVVYGVVLRGAEGEVASAGDAIRQARQRKWFHDLPHAYGRYFLPLLASATGGGVAVADRSRDLRDRFTDVIGEFRARCVLTYSPIGVAKDGWHSIDLRLKAKRGTVRVRPGYLRGGARASY